jgi:hypothetical protein
MGTMTTNDIIVKEEEVNLFPVETKQRLIKINNHEHFIQLICTFS